MIANFEIALGTLTLIIGGILIFSALDVKIFIEKTGKTGLEFLFLLCIPIAFTFPTKNVGFQYSKYFVLLCIVFLILWIAKHEGFAEYDKKYFNICITAFWIVFAIANVISGWLAYYAYNNVDEILSRCMLYRNSNVSLFEYTWKYTLDRFFNIAVSITLCVSWLVGVIFIAFYASKF